MRSHGEKEEYSTEQKAARAGKGGRHPLGLAWTRERRWRGVPDGGHSPDPGARERIPPTPTFAPTPNVIATRPPPPRVWKWPLGCLAPGLTLPRPNDLTNKVHTPLPSRDRFAFRSRHQ